MKQMKKKKRWGGGECSRQDINIIIIIQSISEMFCITCCGDTRPTPSAKGLKDIYLNEVSGQRKEWVHLRYRRQEHPLQLNLLQNYLWCQHGREPRQIQFPFPPGLTASTVHESWLRQGGHTLSHVAWSADSGIEGKGAVRTGVCSRWNGQHAKTHGGLLTSFSSWQLWKYDYQQRSAKIWKVLNKR